MCDKWISIIIGLFAGALGYVLPTFFFQPILRYREIRSRIIFDLIFYANTRNPSLPKEKRVEGEDSARRRSAELEANYDEDLPCLFKKYLEYKKIFPKEAAKALINLANSDKQEDINAALQRIKEHLKISIES